MDRDHDRYELVSLMLGHQFQGIGYGIPAIKLVIEEMKEIYACDEIYLSSSRRMNRLFVFMRKLVLNQQVRFSQAFHPELIYKLKV
ncbi:hypothetical protein [Cytobacillus firmus]|uniref:hypothetical protein n=1 Tax=Cytobacillus firmus TaxID=1399 RepID=UPI0037BFD685